MESGERLVSETSQQKKRSQKSCSSSSLGSVDELTVEVSPLSTDPGVRSDDESCSDRDSCTVRGSVSSNDAYAMFGEDEPKIRRSKGNRITQTFSETRMKRTSTESEPLYRRSSTLQGKTWKKPVSDELDTGYHVRKSFSDSDQLDTKYHARRSFSDVYCENDELVKELQKLQETHAQLQRDHSELGERAKDLEAKFARREGLQQEALHMKSQRTTCHPSREAPRTQAGAEKYLQMLLEQKDIEATLSYNEIEKLSKHLKDVEDEKYALQEAIAKLQHQNTVQTLKLAASEMRLAEATKTAESERENSISKIQELEERFDDFSCVTSRVTLRSELSSMISSINEADDLFAEPEEKLAEVVWRSSQDDELSKLNVGGEPSTVEMEPEDEPGSGGDCYPTEMVFKPKPIENVDSPANMYARRPSMLGFSFPERIRRPSVQCFSFPPRQPRVGGVFCWGG